MVTRRQFLKTAGYSAVAAGSLLAGCQSENRQDKHSKKPNIIFILADDLGYGDLGCYGQKVIQTPHLDTMAREGMRFTDHYAGSTVCAPSRCCWMTGLHSGHALVRGNARIALRPEDRTVAECMKQAGYTTGLIGKWGLGEEGSTGIPNRKGFDHWFGYLNQRHAHNYYPEFLYRNETRVELKNEVRPVGGEFAGVATKRVEYSHDLFTEAALRFLDENANHPFFLCLTYTIPHANNEARNQGMEVPSLGQYADKPWPAPQKGHAAMISRLDSDIGRLMAKLKTPGLDDDTIVLFSSDNGPHKEGGADPAFFDSSGELRGYKRALYEGGIRVPLIARWPGRIKAGSETHHISAFWDFLPTCCGLAGVDTPAGLDGLSFLPTLLGRAQEQAEHTCLYWEFHEQGKKQAVRFGRWKGVRLNVGRNPNGPIEVYDLSTDIGEKNNLAEQHPDIAEQMARYMKEARTPSEMWPLP